MSSIVCTPRVAYNGSDPASAEAVDRPSCHPVLRDKSTLQIEAELSFGGGTLRAIANRNTSGYFFMQKTRLPDDWPTPPDGAWYSLRFRLTRRGVFEPKRRARR